MKTFYKQWYLSLRYMSIYKKFYGKIVQKRHFVNNASYHQGVCQSVKTFYKKAQED